MDLKISSEDFPETSRFEFWREVIGKQHLKYDIEQVDDKSPFCAQLQVAILDEVIFSRARLSAVRGQRTKQHIAEDSLDHYVLAIPVRQSFIVQDEIEYTLTEREMVLFDGTHPLRYQHEDNCGGIIVAIPRYLLEEKLKDPEVRGPRVAPLDHGIGVMVSSFCEALPTVMASRPSPEVRHGLAEQLTALAALAFQPSDEGVAQAQAPLSQMRFGAVKQFISAHLHDPDLCPDTIAQGMGISRSYLYKLFAQHQFGFQRYIRTRRLQKVATLMRNPSLSSQSITDLAMQCGFNNMSYFSRVFSVQFGESPRHYRARMRADNG